MSEVVSAMVQTIGKFVTMLFSMTIETVGSVSVTVGSFLIATALLGAVIRLIFSLINVPGSAWLSKGKNMEGPTPPKFRISQKEE